MLSSGFWYLVRIASLFAPRGYMPRERIWNMKIVTATAIDSKGILDLQRLAYQSEAQRYKDYSIDPLRQTLAEITEQFKTHTFLKTVVDNRIIGTVRAFEENGTCHVGRLAVDPHMQNQGIGQALMMNIEKCFHSKRFELFVGTKSEKNIHLYKKCGYTIFKKSRYGCGDIEVYYMEKVCEKNP
jgi:ribosomal protein S18 acetylase RimI-like enzyme